MKSTKNKLLLNLRQLGEQLIDFYHESCPGKVISVRCNAVRHAASTV